MRSLRILFLILASIPVFGQQTTVQMSVDSTAKKIGAEFRVTVRTTVDTADIVKFPVAPRFGNLEVIRNYKVDTIEQGAKFELIKRYGLTQFDQGKYVIPKLPVKINGGVYFTDAIPIEVAAVKVDTLKQKMFDIKTVVGPEGSTDWSLLWLLLVVVILLAIAIWYAKQKKSAASLEKVVVYKTPIDKATNLLKSLESKQLWQKGEVKAYYSELTDIARTYIEEEIKIPALESTTAELIVALKNVAKQKKYKLSADTLEDLKQVLMQADLVKFAKSKPLEFEIEADKQRIEKTIVTLHQAIPEEILEEESPVEELQESRAAKKRRKRQVRMLVAASISAILLCLGTWIAISGYTEVKDTLLFNRGKILLEGEWIKSEYGYPGITIETPTVLKREKKTLLNATQPAQIANMQSFSSGDFSDAFSISISTLTSKDTTQIPLDKVLEETLHRLERNNARNIIGDQGEFTTPNGISGLRGMGTFSQINTLTNKSTKYYYELFIFNQEGGIQKILLAHPEGDSYGKKIAERVINSIELRQLNNNAGN